MRTEKFEKSVLTEKKPLNDEEIWTYLPHSSPLQFVWLLILSLNGFLMVLSLRLLFFSSILQNFHFITKMRNII